MRSGRVGRRRDRSIPRKLGEAAMQAHRADGEADIKGWNGQEAVCSDLSYSNVAL